MKRLWDRLKMAALMIAVLVLISLLSWFGGDLDDMEIGDE